MAEAKKTARVDMSQEDIQPLLEIEAAKAKILKTALEHIQTVRPGGEAIRFGLVFGLDW